MSYKLLIVGTILLGLSILTHWHMSTADAAVDTASVFWSDEFNESLPQPVNIARTGLPLKYSIGGINPGTYSCVPDQTSINQRSVILKGEDGSSHPIHTVSYSAEPVGQSFYHFRLSIILPYYELAQNTSYQLLFKGGISSDFSTIRFKCSTQPDSFQYFYLPPGDHTLAFETGADTIEPTIIESSVMAALNRAVIVWRATEPVSLNVTYNRQPSMNKSTAIAKRYGLWYVANIANLEPGSRYDYQIEALDQGGNQPSTGTIGSLVTWAISPISITDRTGHEATIKWSTDVDTDSIIEYGLTPNLGQISGSHGLTKNHDVRLVHLQSNRTYYAQIKLLKGGTTSVSNLFTFKTLDAGSGVSTEMITANLDFRDRFDLSQFNFKDFPTDAAASVNDQASPGAVLAAEDDGLNSIAGNFGNGMEHYRWAMWLWVPVLLLLLLIWCIWLLHRHQHRATIVEQEIARNKAFSRQGPPELD